MLQLPEPSAVAVPSTVVPSVSYRVTVLLASAVPVKVGVVLLVLLSVDELPVSVAAVMSGALGAVGAVLSYITVLVACVATLPAASFTSAVMLTLPSVNAFTSALVSVTDQAPPAATVAVLLVPPTLTVTV